MRVTSWLAFATTLGLIATVAAAALGQAPSGDAAKGADVFNDHCSDCHALGVPGQGPNLVGVVGRRAGSLPDYPYSDALKGSGLVWTPANLDRFLAGPKKMVPGTAMQEMVPDPAQRHDLQLSVPHDVHVRRKRRAGVVDLAGGAWGAAQVSLPQERHEQRGKRGAVQVVAEAGVQPKAPEDVGVPGAPGAEGVRAGQLQGVEHG
jgi:cytochrome c